MGEVPVLKQVPKVQGGLTVGRVVPLANSMHQLAPKLNPPAAPNRLQARPVTGSPQPSGRVVVQSPQSGRIQSAKPNPVSAQPSIRAQVTSQVAESISPAKPNQIMSTDDIASPYLHAILYCATDARKSTTAALFGDPADVRIINTRRPEQLIGLRGYGYKFANCQDADSIIEFLTYPEKKFGAEWAERPNRTLILDDITYFKDLELENNETRTKVVSGREVEVEVKDARMMHKYMKQTMWDVICRNALQKPQHFIAVALSDAFFPTPNEERIRPDLPPKLWNLIGADFEYVFYVDKATYKLYTTEHRKMLKKKNDKGQEETYQQIIFAKHKVPLITLQKGVRVIRDEEEMDLRALWERIKTGTAAPVKAGVR